MITLITDWRRHEDDQPDVAPGEDHERVITPQKPVVLMRILIRGYHARLDRVQIGPKEVPFRLMSVHGPRQSYSTLPDDEIPLLAAQDVRLTLHNDGDAPVKPRVALLVREEVT
jgi:hypothetical protein